MSLCTYLSLSAVVYLIMNNRGEVDIAFFIIIQIIIIYSIALLSMNLTYFILREKNMREICSDDYCHQTVYSVREEFIDIYTCSVHWQSPLFVQSISASSSQFIYIQI